MGRIIRSMVASAVLLAASVAWGQQAYTVVVLPSTGYERSYGTGIAGGQAVGYSVGGVGDDALLWDESGGSVIDLNPTGYVGSSAYGSNGTYQVGSATAISGGPIHAMLWKGSSSNYVDLNPPGYSWSEAYGIGGNQVVGFAVDSKNNGHAIVWNINDGSFVDLHTDTFHDTRARATNGIYQVGEGVINDFTNAGVVTTVYALLWNGSADSVVILGDNAKANGIYGDQIVGGNTAGAGMWVGADHAYINLAPPVLGTSEAFATNGKQQVGDVNDFAAAWSGTAGSYEDLNQFLPGNVTYSYAYGIDQEGRIIGVSEGPNGVEAVMWVPVVPEPSICLALGATALMARRQR